MVDVVVTGLGVVSPLGHHLDAYWAGLLAAAAQPKRLDYPGTQLPVTPMYRVGDDFDADVTIDAGRASRFALAAARSALTDAGIVVPAGGEIGVCVGTGTGDGDLLEAARDGRRDLGALQWWPYGVASVLADHLSLAGPNLTVSNACAAGAYAVSIAAHMVASGEVEIVLAGGAEGVSRPAMAAFSRLGAVDPLHCRPFDVHRQGTVCGEGAAFLVLESRGHAAARGRTPHATVLGSGWSCDAFHPTTPEPTAEATTSAALDALDRAAMAASDVGAVVAHGTGTPLNDRTESKTITAVFGDRRTSVPVTAIKSTLGHSGGAAGAFSCLTAALVAKHGLVPAVANLVDLDPQCDISVATRPMPLVEPAVLVNAYAFGGNNISVVIGPAA